MTNLTPEEVGRIKEQNFVLLSEEQFDMFAPEDLAALRGEQFEKIPPASLQKMDAEEFGVLSDDAISGFNQKQMQRIPPEAMKKMDKQKFGALSDEAVEGFDPAKIQQMPDEAWEGVNVTKFDAIAKNKENLQALDAPQLEHIPPNAFGGISGEEIPYMKTEFQQVTDNKKAQVMVNLDFNKVKPEDAADLLDANWEIDLNTGELKPPPGTKVSLPPKEPPPEIKDREDVKIPEMPDFSKDFALGGNTESGTILDDMNQGLASTDLEEFTFSQNDDDGFLQAQGVGEYEDQDFSFIPDTDRMTQVDDTANVGLAVESCTGLFVVTTSDNQRFPLIPAPKGAKPLLAAMGENSSFDLNDDGDTLLIYQENQTRDDSQVNVVVTFDPYVNSSGSDYCDSTLFSCTRRRATPGVHISQNTRTYEDSYVIYEDGTAQKIYPTVLYPQIFIEQLLATFEDIQDACYKADGSFYVMYDNREFSALPIFELEVDDVEGEDVPPSLEMDNEEQLLNYKVQHESQVFTSKVMLIEEE